MRHTPAAYTKRGQKTQKYVRDYFYKSELFCWRVTRLLL